MKDCPKCNTPHNKPGTFCSRNCANGRVQSAETKKKISEANKGKYLRAPTTQEEINNRRIKVQTLRLEKYNNTVFEDLGVQNRKRRLLEEQDNKCNRCGLDKWMGEPLVLEIEHKDGNNTNNARSNVECLCPNCHSLTTTWRGRNNRKAKVSDKDLLVAIQSHDTISRALRSLGMADKGANHARAKKLKNL